jgi:glycosyltransferase involved in cell wall biosynthesis
MGGPPASAGRNPFRLPSHYRYTSTLVPWLRGHAHRFDAILVEGLWNYTSMAARLVLPSVDRPYFVFTHGQLDPWFRQAYPAKDRIKQLSWLAIEGPLLKQATAVLFTTEDELQLARRRYLGHGNFRAEVVGYGITDPPDLRDGDVTAFRRLIPALGKRPFLLFLGRMHAKKGCDLLIESFAAEAGREPRTDLVMAGPDQVDLIPRLKQRCSALGIADRVHWPGMLTGAAKWGALRSADAFVLTSHSENFGIAVAEAMACGTPVLITNKVNIWREVQESGGGLVESDDLKGAMRLLARWSAVDSEGRIRMRRAARTGYERNFRIETTVRRLEELIRSAQQWPRRAG